MKAIVLFERSGTCVAFLTRSSGAGAPPLDEVVGDKVSVAVQTRPVTIPKALLALAEVEVEEGDLQEITSLRVDPNSVPPAAKTSPVLPNAVLSLSHLTMALTWTGGPAGLTGRVVTSEGQVIDLPSNQDARRITLDFAADPGGSFVVFPDGFAPVVFPPLPTDPG